METDRTIETAIHRRSDFPQKRSFGNFGSQCREVTDNPTLQEWSIVRPKNWSWYDWLQSDRVLSEGQAAWQR